MKIIDWIIVVMIVVLAVGIFVILLVTAIIVVCCLRSRRAKGSITGGPSFLRWVDFSTMKWKCIDDDQY